MPEILFQQFAGSGPAAAIIDFIGAGGPVLLLVAAAGAMLWALILERWWYFRRVYPRVERDVLARWRSRRTHHSWTAQRVRGALIRRTHAQAKVTLPLMQTLIAACPLLGLLGTVTGMIAVFDVVALVGTGDAQAMAAGVSRATVPTMAGMVVGISGLFPLYRLQARADAVSHRLADQLQTTSTARGARA